MKSHLNLIVLALLAGACLFGLNSTSAQAENIAKMLDDSGIEPESLSLMQDAAKALYTAQKKSVGDAKDWTNTATGTSGKVEIVGLKNDCVQLFHSLEVARPSKVTEISVWRCRTSSGDWQLTASP
ncbi:MAG: hypothetical protein AAGF53_04585 [Pseudomonadota bacterium]